MTGQLSYPSVLLVIFYILQAADILITLNCGGLAVEVNPVVVYLWYAGGPIVPILAKVATSGLVCISWGIYDEWLKFSNWPLSLIVVIGSAIPVGWNIGGLIW